MASARRAQEQLANEYWHIDDLILAGRHAHDQGRSMTKTAPDLG